MADGGFVTWPEGLFAWADAIVGPGQRVARYTFTAWS